MKIKVGEMAFGRWISMDREFKLLSFKGREIKLEGRPAFLLFSTSDSSAAAPFSWKDGTRITKTVPVFYDELCGSGKSASASC